MKKMCGIIFLLFCFVANAQKTDTNLQNEISDMLQGFHGNIGVYVYDLRKNRVAAINADTIYPTASIVKIPICIGVMHKIYKGNWQRFVNYNSFARLLIMDFLQFPF